MYCRKCGSELKDSDKFCGKCGEPTNSVNVTPASSAPQVSPTPQALPDRVPICITLITAIVMLISPFLNIFYINLWEEKSFSPINMVKLLKEIAGYYSTDSESTLTILAYVLFIFYISLFFVSVVSFLVSLGKIFAAGTESELSYFRNISLSNSFAFVANLVLFLGLLATNWIITNDLGCDTFIWIFGANILFVIIMIVGLVGSCIASNKVRAYLKK